MKEKPCKRMLILCYHSISNDRSDDLAVRVSDFKQQIEYLLRRGYESISLKSCFGQFQKKELSSQKRFALTFDDGYADNYFNAFPILKKYNLTATIFLITDYVGTDRLFKSEKYIEKFGGSPEMYKFLNWDQVREMKEWRISFGSHTCSHPILTEISPQEAEKEIKDSKFIIEKNIGEKIDFFCYPSGRFNESHIESLKMCGYKGGVITPVQTGVKDNLYALKRISVYRADRGLRFRIKISKSFPKFRETMLFTKQIVKK